VWGDYAEVYRAERSIYFVGWRIVSIPLLRLVIVIQTIRCRNTFNTNEVYQSGARRCPRYRVSTGGLHCTVGAQAVRYFRRGVG
jgi:hypothetical protein